MRALEWFLNLECDPLKPTGFLLVTAQGLVVLTIGVGLAARTFVKNGFRFPSA